MECERFINGEINCGVCVHAWREANLEDCDEGCDDYSLEEGWPDEEEEEAA